MLLSKIRSEDRGHAVIVGSEIFEAAAIGLNLGAADFAVVADGRGFGRALDDEQLKEAVAIANAVSDVTGGGLDGGGWCVHCSVFGWLID
jgi:hypothetical protein